MTELTLDSGWSVLQDVHDSGERLGLERGDERIGTVGSQLSEWEPIARLEHLQLRFADTPYWGRSLRWFNQAPWWYRNEFTVPADDAGLRILRFTNVDYYAKVWLNGVLLGEHEGYAAPFEFYVTDHLRVGEPNRLIVKVWSPWDSEVRDDQWESRYSRVRRRMVKGTYEHDDGFIQRDVNPVGIYGTVTVSSFPTHRIGTPTIDYDLDVEARTASVVVTGRVVGAAPADLGIQIVDPAGSVVAAAVAPVTGDRYEARLELAEVLVWESWDRGTPHRYTVRVSGPDGQSAEDRVGFRTIELVRTEEETTFVLNGRRFYVRGASYFPDVYISRMDTVRWRRDLDIARAAGLNLLRVHVHTEPPEFYALCDEYGIGLMQDSDFNWDHPESAEWTDILVSVFSDMIRLLAPRPSVFAWICMNEPGVFVAENYLNVRPGPQLYAAAQELDPRRPAIKGSGMSEDPLSAESHNYLGSLAGESTQYTDIDGTAELLNTEFGVDAPGVAENLATTGALYRRLEALVPSFGELQEYQYRLLKYYIEHYRIQRFDPCSGYVQFMLIDLCPQSWYGVYDYWGTPKRGLDAFLESGQPVAVLLEQYATRTSAVWLVNDTFSDLGEVRVTWTATDANGSRLANGEATVDLPADSRVQVAPLELAAGSSRIDVELVATTSDGRRVAANAYRGLFDHPRHPAGHPARFSQEFGVRVFSAP